MPLVAALVATGCAEGPSAPAEDADGGGSPGPGALGSVAVVSGPAACGEATCWEVGVSCPGVRETDVASLEVVEAAGAARGTVVLFSGGAGTGRWAGRDASALAALEALRAAGFGTIQVSWAGGWLFGSSPDEGHAALACRPATVLDWLHDEPRLHPGGAFCATGNSGGAAQVSYALSHYGLDEILDLVVPTEGPPMARIDRGCDRDDPADEALWYGVGAAARIDRGFGFAGGGPCERSDPAFDDRFRAASVVGKDGDYRHPSTRIHFVMGSESASEAQAHGIVYRDRLLEEPNDVVLEFAPATPHRVQSTAEGAGAIREAVLAGCRER